MIIYSTFICDFFKITISGEQSSIYEMITDNSQLLAHSVAVIADLPKYR